MGYLRAGCRRAVTEVPNQAVGVSSRSIHKLKGLARLNGCTPEVEVGRRYTRQVGRDHREVKRLRGFLARCVRDEQRDCKDAFDVPDLCHFRTSRAGSISKVPVPSDGLSTGGVGQVDRLTDVYRFG